MFNLKSHRQLEYQTMNNIDKKTVVSQTEEVISGKDNQVSKTKNLEFILCSKCYSFEVNNSTPGHSYGFKTVLITNNLVLEHALIVTAIFKIV